MRNADTHRRQQPILIFGERSPLEAKGFQFLTANFIQAMAQSVEVGGHERVDARRIAAELSARRRRPVQLPLA